MPKLLSDFHQCGHCGRKQSSETNPDGFVLSFVSTCFRIACPCGIMTRLCQTKQDLQVLWNSRVAKPWRAPVIRVKHPPARGQEPELRDPPPRSAEVDPESMMR